MKIIFLDVDGVMNNELWYRSKDYTDLKEDYDKSMFDPRCIDLLNCLTNKTKAKIVVSSSWRLGRTVEELKELFERLGITGEVIDKTGRLDFIGIEDYNYSVPRGCEIKAWLELNKNILGEKITNANYVILDDDSDMLYWQRNNFIWVDPYCGLTPCVIVKAEKVLTKGEQR